MTLFSIQLQEVRRNVAILAVRVGIIVRGRKLKQYAVARFVARGAEAASESYEIKRMLLNLVNFLQPHIKHGLRL